MTQPGTNFPNGLYSYGLPVGLGVPMSQGRVIFLKPSSGDDGKTGKTPDQAVKTYSQALSLVTADKQDTIVAFAESNSAASTTDYQSSTLTISKDGTRILGQNAGGVFAMRSRIAQLSTATGVSPLVTISCDNGVFANLHVFHGVGDATSKIAVRVSGDRNYFFRCHFAGIGHATMDVAGAASLSLQGAENLFEECVIGLDTIARGTAANSEILLDGSGNSAARNVFRRCIIPTNAEANTHQFLIANSSSMDRVLIFEDCIFYNPVDSAATAMTEAFDLHASQGGTIVLKNCGLYGAAEWDAGDTGNILIVGASGIAATSGIAVEPAV